MYQTVWFNDNFKYRNESLRTYKTGWCGNVINKTSHQTTIIKIVNIIMGYEFEQY